MTATEVKSVTHTNMNATVPLMHVITIGESLVAAIHTSHATDRGVNHLITRLPSHMGATWINHG